MTSNKKNNFSKLRRQMVEKQLKSRDITDKKLLRVMNQVPREKFIPPAQRGQAYFDGPLPIGRGQTISQPYIVALMTQLLALSGQEKVLEIGTGSGYQAAVLSCLARKVYSIERHAPLLAKAKKIFKKLGLINIKTKIGDGSKGWKKFAPFEAIIVTAAALEIPPALTEQLAEDGRLVIPVGSRFYQELIRVTKKDKKLIKENFGGCAFVPLIAEQKNLKSQASNNKQY